MRNGSSRRETGGAHAKAFCQGINARKARRTLDAGALVVLELSPGVYRRLTPENAERLARELRGAALEARERIAAAPLPPEPPPAGVAALPAA